MSILIPILIFSIFILIGFFIYNLSSSEKNKWRDSKRWLKTRAIPHSVEMKVKTDSDLQSVYSVDLLYSYTFDSIVYKNNKICFGYSPSSSYNFHFKIYSKVKSAREFEIWINPVAPNEAVVVKDIASTNNFVANFGLVFILVGLAMMTVFILFRIPNNISLIHQIQTFK